MSRNLSFQNFTKPSLANKGPSWLFHEVSDLRPEYFTLNWSVLVNWKTDLKGMILHGYNCLDKSTLKASVVLRYNVWIVFLDKTSTTKRMDVYLAGHHVYTNNTPIVIFIHGRPSASHRKLRRQNYSSTSEDSLISHVLCSCLNYFTRSYIVKCRHQHKCYLFCKKTFVSL